MHTSYSRYDSLARNPSYHRDNLSYSSSHSSGRYASNGYHSRGTSDLLSKYSDMSGVSPGYNNSLLEKSRKNGLAGITPLPSKKHDVTSARNFSSTVYSTSSSRTGRSESKARDIVRPSTRDRRTSLTREGGRTNGEVKRGRSLSRPKNSTEYPPLTQQYRTKLDCSDDTPTYKRYSSPERTTHPPVPEFSEIPSPSYSRGRRNGTKTTRSPSHINGGSSHLLNGHSSSPLIETKRTIHYNPSHSISADDQPVGSYSPSFAQNRTSNNNNDFSRSSAGSKRDETNSAVSPSSGSRDFSNVNSGRVGLKNIGNTCFMNSILQCLSNTKALRDYCIDDKYKRDVNRTSSPMKGNLIEAFCDIIKKLWDPLPSGLPVPTSGFKSQIQKFSKRFSGYEQQDCQEFLRFLIEGLHEDVNKILKKPKSPIPNFDSLCDESKAEKTWKFYLSKDRSYIVDLFMGQLKSSLECAECSHVSTTFDPFWDLSLPLPKDSYRDTRLEDCLSNFTKEEILEGDERPTCEKCKARRRMTKKFTIYKFPKILVIHLKRFNEGQRFRHKLSLKVDFPHQLNIKSPVSVSSERFDLYAVSNHSGSCYGGHYTAYCKNPETEEWHSFNDSLVSQMRESSVQSKEAYVLFYEASTRSSKSHL